MELSKVPTIMRWCAYLQSFQFMVRHIPGKQNVVVADFLSRFMFLFRPLDIDYPREGGGRQSSSERAHILAIIDQQEEDIDAVTKVFRACHKQRTHWTFIGRALTTLQTSIFQDMEFLSVYLWSL